MLGNYADYIAANAREIPDKEALRDAARAYTYAQLDALVTQSALALRARGVAVGEILGICLPDTAPHVIMLLAAARHLAVSRDFAGTINFIFQPAEETISGAKAMIADGLFERFPCDAVFAVHNRPSLQLGQAIINGGAMMAGAAVFNIVVHGQGGHGARPHQAVDPVPATAQLIQALQTIVSRRTDPLQSAVVTIGAIAGGDAVNVIPESVTLGGTARAFDNAMMALIETEMARICRGVAEASGTRIGLTFDYKVRPTVNDKSEAAIAHRALAAVLGHEQVLTDQPPAPGSEDFADMLEVRPGAYAILGMREGHDLPMIHNAGYDFNDALLPIGASYFVRLAQQRLPLV